MDEPIKLLMRRPSLDGLPDPAPLGPGYRLGQAAAPDADGIAALLTSAFLRPWSTHDVHTVLLDAAHVNRTFVITAGSEVVATSSAQILPSDPARGRLHWVATHPQHRRRGLGRSIALTVLHRLRQVGCSEGLLTTDPPRLDAIRLYLDLGFEPAPLDARHAACWRELLAVLRP